MAFRQAFRVLAQRAPVATAAAATALVVAPPSRCDWWSSKTPSAPAPAAVAAPPVVEPKTGVQFPAEQGGLKLAGCGVRVKYGFIKVYAVGVYVSPRVALDKRAASPLAALRTARRDGAVVELRLTMARDAPKKTFVDALAEQITPRAGAPQSDTFAAAITAALACGDAPITAVERAKRFVSGRLRASTWDELDGAGPVAHWIDP